MHKTIKDKWGVEITELTQKLHQEISLNDKNWHALRANKKRRVAELIVSALSQIVNEGSDKDIKALLEQAIKWLDNQIKDSGCQNH